MLVDDIHWAEPALLELLAGAPAQSEDAPLLVLCLARPELLERESPWEATVRLQPLERDDAEALVGQLLGEAVLPTGVAERVSDAAAGNPLFVEELVGMLIDDGMLERSNGKWVANPSLAELTIPPTLRELLGARLDRLATSERSALERGSVEGQVFHRGAVLELSEEPRTLVPESLLALVEREYLRPERAEFVDESAFRVRHVLIRDAAYEGIPKKLRSSLHERLAAWLEAKAGARATEYEEIIGYHLEQAYRYRAELGPIGAAERDLALRAEERLEQAGRRALDRRDSSATVNLLSRAIELLPGESNRRLELLQFVGEELGFMMEVERASDTFRRVVEGASALGDRRLETHGRIWQGVMRFWADPDFGVLELLAEADAAARVFEEIGDEKGIARTHDWRAFSYSHLGRFSDSEQEAGKAIELFRRVGDRRLAVEQFWYLAWAADCGPRHVDDGVTQCLRILEEAGDDAAVEGHTRFALARLEAKRGRFDIARQQADDALAVFETTGMLFASWYPVCRGEIEMLAGELAAAERELRRSLEPLEAAFDFVSLTNAASLLAHLLVDRGATDEAASLAAQAVEWAPKDQPIQHAHVRAVQGRLLARQEHPDAQAVVREAVALADETDYVELQARCRVALADVLRLAGREAEAADALAEACRLYERKGNVVSASAVRDLL